MKIVVFARLNLVRPSFFSRRFLSLIAEIMTLIFRRNFVLFSWRVSLRMKSLFLTLFDFLQVSPFIALSCVVVNIVQEASFLEKLSD